MATLRQVETFSVTFSASATTKTHTLTTTLLDKDKAFLVFGVERAGSDSDYSCVMGIITNTTTLTFTRSSGVAGTPTMKGYVVEFTAGVNVDHGTLTSFGASENTAALVNVTDLSKAFVLTSGRVFGLTQTTRHHYSARLFDSAGLKVGIQSGAFTGAPDYYHTVVYQAIEYDSCAVQRGTIADMTGTSQTATFSAVDLAKSFCTVDYIVDGSFGTGMDDWTLKCQFDSTTQISATRINGADRTLGDGNYQVVEFTDSTTVQEIDEVLVATTGFTGTNTLTTLSDSAANAICFTPQRMYYNQVSDIFDAWGAAGTTFDITSATNLTVTRGDAAGELQGTFYVVDFAQGDPPVVTVPTANYYAFSGVTKALTSLVSVADSGNNLATIRVRVTAGATCNVTNLSSCTVSAGSRDSVDFTLSGTQANLNTAIGLLTMDNTTTGTKTITITANDGTDTDEETFSVIVGATSLTLTADTPGDTTSLNACLATLDGMLSAEQISATVTILTTDSAALTDSDMVLLSADRSDLDPGGASSSSIRRSKILTATRRLSPTQRRRV
jgi:hypothetical protein